MIYIKYKDPSIVKGNKFFSKQTILEKYSSRIVETVGFKVNEDEKHIVICHQVTTSGTRKGYSGLMSIPKKMVLENSNCIGDEFIQTEFLDAKYLTDYIDEKLIKNQFGLSDLKVKIGGFLVQKDEINTFIAMERNIEGKYRTISCIPNDLITKW